jgi:GNAT superfamily N-acetyltransferase
LTGKPIRIRAAALGELDEVAAFCAGRDHDPVTRDIKRRRRQWLEEMAGHGLGLVIAVDPTPPAVVTWGNEKVAREELTLLADGLVVGLLQYAPVEVTWYPVDGDGYLFVECLWVEPGYTGRGVGRGLLTAVIREARRVESGVAVIAWRGASPAASWAYMPATFFRNNGFEIVAADGDRVLMAVSYGAKTKPRLLPAAEVPETGWTLLSHPGCPASRWAVLEAEQAAAASGAALAVAAARTRAEARARGALFGVCRDGKVVLNRLASAEEIKKALGLGGDDSSTD